MIVLDASAAAELILETEAGARVAAGLRGERLHVPAHFDVEVAAVVRRAILRGLLDDRSGVIAVSELRSLPVRRWPVPALLTRAFELRATHGVADAVYVALAEALDAHLLTCDKRLARSHGHDARIIEV